MREAIAAANNEIHRQASTRPEWQGMACVLTVALVEGERAVVGHVGDTRLYKLRGGALQKITHDHSPIGEREDAGEISEWRRCSIRGATRCSAMWDRSCGKPRTRTSSKSRKSTVEPDAALLLCSDGLTDLVPSATVKQVVASHAGRPEKVAERW